MVCWTAFCRATPRRSRPRAPGPGREFGFDGTDDELLAAARAATNGDRFAALYDRGDISAHDDDDSRADLALCSALAWWAGPDAERIDRLFRGSALMRDKWERANYREPTIARATARSEFRQYRYEEPERSPESGAAAEDVWESFDLAGCFENPPEPPERIGQRAQFYQGKLHWLSGEPESGKSTVAYHVALEEMEAGRTVLILDEEAGPEDVWDKLAALGATEELMRKHLVYLPPAGRNLEANRKRLFALVAQHRVSLVVVDSAAAHLAVADKDEDRGPEVTQFVTRALLPLAQKRGVAVFVIDHKTKADPQHRYAKGSGDKLGRAEVAYNLSAPEPYSRERSGRLHVVCTKDRPGYYGRDTSWMVYLNVTRGARDAHATRTRRRTHDREKALAAAGLSE